jgi:hypothetical protein
VLSLTVLYSTQHCLITACQKSCTALKSRPVEICHHAVDGEAIAALVTSSQESGVNLFPDVFAQSYAKKPHKHSQCTYS